MDLKEGARIFMPKKSALKEIKCMVASLKPIMLVQNNDDMKDAQNIECLYRYVVELFDGIAKNEANEFTGKFDFSVSLTPSRFLVYKKFSGKELSEKEYEEFMTAISIFQMVFIDENIYLTGNISKRTLIVSKEGIIWGTDDDINENKILVRVEKNLADKFDNKFVANIEDTAIVDFLPTIYRFSPFKDEEGNIMRHIVAPLNLVKKENEELLENLIKYCQNYIKIKKFDLKL